MSATFAEMYAAFQKLFPTVKLSYAEFKLLKPWNLKKAYRETCLCRTCELFGMCMYREALQKVGTALEPILAPSDHGLEDGQGDGDGDDSGTPGGVGAEGSGGDGGSTSSRDPLTSTASDIPALQALAHFCRLKRKGELAQALVCGGCIETAQPTCLSGKCASCGFAKLWQPVRERLVDGAGKLRDGIDTVWQSTVRYEVLKSGKKSRATAATPSQMTRCVSAKSHRSLSSLINLKRCLCLHVFMLSPRHSREVCGGRSELPRVLVCLGSC
jgi:hypothetical protein